MPTPSELSVNGTGRPNESKSASCQANYVRALPLHPTQRETERTAEYSVFEYRLAPTYDFRMELLSNGADVEVLRPAWFREEVKSVVERMCKKYLKE